MLIRDADPLRDAEACAAIYAPCVRDSASSFEEVAPGADEMAARIAVTRARWPWLVAELDGTVAGYAYGSRHRERAAYRWATDVSVYVSADDRRRGAARALYVELLARLTGQGMQIACAGIALPNPASVALHESLGFRPVGVYRAIGYKLGRWWDVGWWQLALGPAAPGDGPPGDGPPAEPRPPAERPPAQPRPPAERPPAEPPPPGS